MVNLKNILNKLNLKLNIDAEEIKLGSIKFNEEKMDLNLVFFTGYELDEKIKNEIREALKDYLKEILVNVYFEVKEIKEIEDKVFSFLIKNCPSIQSWLKKEDLKIDEDLKTINLEAPDKITYKAILNNDALKRLNDEVLKDNYKFQLTFNEEFKEAEDLLNDYYKELENMEKEACKSVQTANQNLSFKKTDKEIINTYGKKTSGEEVSINDLSSEFTNVKIKGYIFKLDSKETKSGKILAMIYLTDYSNSIECKVFISNKKAQSFFNSFKVNDYVEVCGKFTFDSFSKTDVIMVNYIKKLEKIEKEDKYNKKRVELRLHSKMTTMSGVTEFSKFAKKAQEWGHPAIAITDLTDVQAFPEASEFAEKNNIKILYGLDGRMIEDEGNIVDYYENHDFNNSYVVFDIETTGLSPYRDKITEIGAVKVVDGEIVDRFSQLINPEREIPLTVQNLTGLSNAMLADEPTIDKVIYDFKNFIEGSTLVAHNAQFDISFIRREMNDKNLNFDYPVLDTLFLSRALLKGQKRFNLSAISKVLGVSLIGAHRAVNDAEATAHVFIKLLSLAGNPKSFEEINLLFKDIKKGVLFPTSMTILIKDKVGLKNLYKLVSQSHLNYFSKEAKIPKSLLKSMRQGLLYGSGNSESDLWQAIYFKKPQEEILKIAEFYDYLEIQPIDNNINYIVQDKLTKDDLININKEIVRIGKKLNKIVVADSDSYYLDQHEDLIRRIVLNGKQGPTREEEKIPQKLYFRTSDEMMEEFNYLGEEKEKIVIDNTIEIANMCQEIKPLPDGKFPPYIEGSEHDLREMTYKKAHEIYGENLPKIVEDRLEKELNSIIGNGYAVLYIIAQKLVTKSNKDGYLVGSRGSVGSSFAATMAGITEVNPLPPHYVCPKCKHSEFVDEKSVGSGIDLPVKNCPLCGEEMRRDGHNIPFEVFLGFEGDKEPDIDLNFAGEYQPVAHKYTEELFGEGYVFRAGTIGTIAEKTAYGYINDFYENKMIRQAEKDRLAGSIVGIKRTTGQHPGGVMIVPKTSDIFDFSPIQHPADKASTNVITTHFDYNFLHGKILKLDILGHDGPTIIKMLEDLTKVNSSTIELNDERTMKLFSSTEGLGIDEKICSTPTGTLGIPEFGTDFVKRMLIKTKPKTFSELVRISGLSHGTDVWTNNAEILVDEKRAELSQVISTREDIMIYLIQAGAENKMAFFTMEKVRKGKGLTEEQMEIMKKLPLPDWYIDACLKIKYMFPKAHAVAYVMLSFRVAWYKLNYPLAFYTTYFTNKLSDFSLEYILAGQKSIKERIQEISNDPKPTQKDKDQKTVLELALEMISRGYNFLGVDIYKSDAKKFKIEGNNIRVPLMSLPGLGENIANEIVKSSENYKYISVEDFIEKTKATKSIVEMLKNQGCFDNMDTTNQISIFNFL